MKKNITVNDLNLQKTAEFQYKNEKYTTYLDLNETLFTDERYVFTTKNNEPFYVGTATDMGRHIIMNMKNPNESKLPKNLLNEIYC